jgi:hypothetical protein
LLGDILSSAEFKKIVGTSMDSIEESMLAALQYLSAVSNPLK